MDLRAQPLRYVVLATDGFWDVCTNQEAILEVNYQLDKQQKEREDRERQWAATGAAAELDVEVEAEEADWELACGEEEVEEEEEEDEELLDLEDGAEEEKEDLSRLSDFDAISLCRRRARKTSCGSQASRKSGTYVSLAHV